MRAAVSHRAASKPSISTPTSAKSPGSTPCACAPTSPTSTAATTGSRSSALEQDGFADGGRRAVAERYGARRGSACSWAPARPASCRPSSRIASAIRRPARCPPTSTTPRRTTRRRSADFVAALSRARRSGVRRVVGVLVEREGVRQRSAHDRSGRMRRRRRRRRRFAVPDDAVRLPFAGTACRASRAARSMSTATASRSAKAPASRCSNGDRHGRRTRSRCSGVGESSDAYHMSTPHPEGLGARLAMERALRVGGPRRLPTSTTSICTVPATPHATTPPKTAPYTSCSAPIRRAARPRATTGHTLGAAGSHRSGHLDARDRAGLHARRRARRGRRPGAAQPLPARQRDTPACDGCSPIRSASAAPTAAWSSGGRA